MTVIRRDGTAVHIHTGKQYKAVMGGKFHQGRPRLSPQIFAGFQQADKVQKDNRSFHFAAVDPAAEHHRLWLTFLASEKFRIAAAQGRRPVDFISGMGVIIIDHPADRISHRGSCFHRIFSDGHARSDLFDLIGPHQPPVRTGRDPGQRVTFHFFHLIQKSLLFLFVTA